MPLDPTAIMLALISALTTILVALVARNGRRSAGKMDALDEKIDGVLNGTRREVQMAMAQLLKEKAVRELYNLPMRRIGDTPPSVADEGHLSRSPEEIAAAEAKEPTT